MLQSSCGHYNPAREHDHFGFASTGLSNTIPCSSPWGFSLMSLMFTPLNEQPQNHCPIPQVGHSREGKREASSSSQEFCAWSAPFLLGFLNEHSFNCAGTVPVNVINTCICTRAVSHLSWGEDVGSSVSINSPHMMLSRVSVETV